MNEKRALTGLAGFATLAAGSMAYGDIVPVAVPSDITANGNTGFGGNSVFWDIDGDGVDDLEIGHRGTPISTTYQWQANVYTLDGSAVSGYGGVFVTYYGTKLDAGDSVAASGLVGDGDGGQIALGSDYFSTAYGGFGATGGNSTTGYLGFQLGSGNYGWVEMTAGPDGIQFHTAAYENMGNDIQAGAIPAPASLSLLAMGAGALMGRRKRKA